MEKRKSDRQHACAKILLYSVLLLFASAGVDGSEPPGPTAKDSQTAAPPDEITVARQEIMVRR